MVLQSVYFILNYSCIDSKTIEKVCAGAATDKCVIYIRM